MASTCWCGQDAAISHAHGAPVRPLGVTPFPAPSAAPIDTSNRHMVARNGHGIIVMLPPRGVLDDEAAINLAAWLCAMTTDGGGVRFAAVLRAIKST